MKFFEGGHQGFLPTIKYGCGNMHNFSDLVRFGAQFNLSALNLVHKDAIEQLQESSSSSLVKVVQLVQLQKIISVVGMFSIFEAVLQEKLQCKDGFRQADEVMRSQGLDELREQFSDMQLAINVLKHGKGRSYDVLLGKASHLSFRVKLSDECFFEEGDISEVQTLITVDDAFVMLCAEIIQSVSMAVLENY